ncbi:MAG: tRNA pseudouridine(38-40) synthase TruA [candidate division WOR-3 bacterium]|nr:tRNA pseudouridine(38-40) synthase TruA [candidate division WOR-3 bacterium]MDH5682909.1 tRNA pseudouridine(38-40) synthase TruA [candidate division WOR-3 bacterium]
MRNILLEIEYDGTDYFGWQYQPNKKTIQGTIEETLKKFLNEPINLIGTSRTDAGVSALGQVANFLCNSQLSVKSIQAALNSSLPRDIYIKKAYSVHLLFHARFDAKSKIYRYQIIFGRSPLRQRFAWALKYRLNVARMEQTSELFIGNKDYHWFCETKNENGYVNVMDINFKKNQDLAIEIEANRFLYKMVRRIVGALVDIGRGRINKQDILNRFLNKKHKPLIVAPPSGLVLLKVKY